MISKVLVPTDFSPLADNAIKYAGELCKHTNAQMILLHVLQINSADLQMPATYADEMMTEQQELANTKLDTAKAFIRHNYGISVDSITIFGAIAEEIANYAQENNVDAVVMSTHGMTSFLDRIFGTNTSATIQKIKTPLLVIPQETSFKAVKNVAIATDYSGSEISYLNFVHSMTHNVPVNFHFLHVNNPDLVPENAITDKELETYAPNLFFHEITGDDVIKSVKTFVESHQIDMMIVTHHERSFLSELFHTSIAKELSHITNIPMLVFHDQVPS